MDTGITETLYADYLAALIRGDRLVCADIVKRLLDDGLDVGVLYAQLFQRSMYEVGEKWESGEIAIATEHLATSVTESLMPLVYPLVFSREHLPHTAVVSCVSDEYHQMGGRMVADIFEMNRWNGYFLGANTALPELQTLVDEKSPDVVALSVSIYSNLPNLEKAITGVREVRPTIPILIGGQAFLWGGRDIPSRHEGIQLLTSLSELQRWTREFVSET